MANDGSITKHAPGVWDVVLSCGKNPVTGKYDRRTRRVTGTKADALEALEELRKERNNGLRMDASRVTFAEYAERWLENGETLGQWAASTATRYRGIVATLTGYFGSLKLSEIRPQLIERMQVERVRAGKSKSTVAKERAVLYEILEQAVLYDLILRNPCAKVKPPKADPVERKSLTASELRSLMRALDAAEAAAYEESEAKEARQLAHGNAFGRMKLHDLGEVARVVAARIGLATGERRGEVLGLRWCDVDLRSGSLRVAQSLDKNGKPKPPKTAYSSRTVAIDAATVQSLAAWGAYQARQLRKIGVKVQPETPVISNALGEYVDPANFSRWWRSWTAEQGFPGLRFHELRHTQATLLLGNGADLKTVQTRLGHASAAFTLRQYTHAIPENDRRAADLFARIAAGEEQENPVQAGGLSA